MTKSSKVQVVRHLSDTGGPCQVRFDRKFLNRLNVFVAVCARGPVRDKGAVVVTAGE